MSAALQEHFLYGIGRRSYSEAKDQRIAKTYAQLSGKARTGRSLFEELKSEDWRLPESGRPYTRGEFDQHLVRMVGKKRLHLVPLGRLSADAARELRRDLKEALTRVASDRGDIGPLLHEVERVAKYLTGDHKTALGKAVDAMRTLVELSATWAMANTGLRRMSWDRLYSEVREARNDIAHTGTEAVLARTLTMALTTVLLEALLGIAGEGEMKRVRDVMVADPVCAHGWQTVADVRRTMLVTDFTELPIADGAKCDEWEMVTSEGLAEFLATQREARFGMCLADARKEKHRPLRTRKAPTVGETTRVRDVWEGAPGRMKLPLVVTRRADDGPVLVGIVTSFDLL